MDLRPGRTWLLHTGCLREHRPVSEPGGCALGLFLGWTWPRRTGCLRRYRPVSNPRWRVLGLHLGWNWLPSDVLLEGARRVCKPSRRALDLDPSRGRGWRWLLYHRWPRRSLSRFPERLGISRQGGRGRCRLTISLPSLPSVLLLSPQCLLFSPLILGILTDGSLGSRFPDLLPPLQLLFLPSPHVLPLSGTCGRASCWDILVDMREVLALRAATEEKPEEGRTPF